MLEQYEKGEIEISHFSLRRWCCMSLFHPARAGASDRIVVTTPSSAGVQP